MTAQSPTFRKVIASRARLLINHPFFGQLAMRLEIIERPDIGTAATNGRQYLYNPEFMEKFDGDERTAITAHEVMHCVLEHCTRRGERNPTLWNYAGDYVINLILKDSGFKLPADILLDEQFRDMTTDAVYDKLLKKFPPQLQKLIDKGGSMGSMGEVMDADGNAVDTTELSEDWKQAVAVAAETARQQGKLPAGLDRFVTDLLEPQVAWQALLRDFLHEPYKGDYTWKRPNKRFAHQGLHFPTMRTDCTGEIVVAIDTSGSIDGDMLTRFFSEVNAIFSEVKPSALHVIYCDAKVGRVDTFNPGDTPEAHPNGGGGTDFVPPFTYLEEQGIVPAAFVYLTDLCCSSYPSEPAFPVLWACWEKTYTAPPYGQVIVVD